MRNRVGQFTGRLAFRQSCSCFVRWGGLGSCHARRTPRPADPDDLRQLLAFALTFDGRRQFKTSGEMMARITAEHLVRHLEQSGYVVMKRRPRQGHSTSGLGKPGER